MTERQLEILELLQKDYSPYEICTALGINLNKLFIEMNNLKFSLRNTKRFMPNGSFHDTGEEQNEYAIWTKEKCNHFKFIILGDTHVGSKYESEKNINVAINFADKNKIHYILNLGDLIDGELGPAKSIGDVDKQIDRFIRVYPRDDSMINLVCLGNHDFHIHTATNLAKKINESRPDVVCMGYGTQEVKIKNDSIILRHPIATEKEPKGSLILRGHSHIALFNQNNYIFCPAISNVLWEGNQPGFYILEVEFKNGYLWNGEFHHYIINGNNVIKASAFKTDFEDNEKAKQKTIGHIL